MIMPNFHVSMYSSICIYIILYSEVSNSRVRKILEIAFMEH